MSVKDPWNQSWGMERGPAFWKRWPSSWVCTIALNCNIFNHGHETDSRRAEGRTGGSHSQHYFMPHTVGRGMIIMRYRFASFLCCVSPMSTVWLRRSWPRSAVLLSSRYCYRRGRRKTSVALVRLVLNRERKSADTVGTVLVLSADQFQC